jgi:hypothetical protein
MSHMQIADFNGHYKDATTGNYWASITLVADATGQGQNYLENLLIVASNYSSGETFSNSNWTTVSIPI